MAGKAVHTSARPSDASCCPRSTAGTGGSSGVYWTELQNPDCDPVLRDQFPEWVTSERDPEPRSVGPGRSTGLIRRSVASELVLDGYCDWAFSLGINTMGMVSIRDQVARLVAPGHFIVDGVDYFRPELCGVISRRYARMLCVNELLTMPWTDGKRGFPWPFMVSSEDTSRSGRFDVAHIHMGVVLPPGEGVRRLMLGHLEAHFYRLFGISRFRIMYDQVKANRYGFKDVLKQVKDDPGAVYVRARPLRRRRRS